MTSRKTTSARAITASKLKHPRAAEQAWPDEAEMRSAHFCEADRNLPIAGTPSPMPCPFCGSDDGVVLVIKELQESDSSKYSAVHAECTICGAQAPGVTSNEEGIGDTSHALVLEAARRWNRKYAAERKGKRGAA